jgi:hypothetical protein
MYGQVHRNRGPGSEGFEKSAMYVIRADQNDTFNCHGQDNAGLLIADVDNDGFNDIIVAGSSTGFGIPVFDNDGNLIRNGQHYDLGVLFNDGSGINYQAWENIGPQLDDGTTNGGAGNVDQPNIAAGDLTGDGRMEIFIQGHHPDYVDDRPGYYIFDTMLMLNNGDRTLTEVDLNLPDVGEGGQAMADFNNDGKLDLVFAGATIPWHTNGANGLDQNDSSTLITEVYRNETSAALESVLEINRDRLNFGADSSGLTTGAQVLLITNSGSGTMNWSAAADSNWLDYSPSSGTNDGEIIAWVDASGLSKGTYNGTVTITAPNAVNSPQTLNVTLKVYNNGETSEPFGQFTTAIDGSTV